MTLTIRVIAITFVKMVVTTIRKRNIQGMSRHPRQGWWGAAVLALVLAFTGPADLGGQDAPSTAGRKIHRSVPPQGAKTHTVVPGERFRAGGFKKWFYGSDYRHLWTTPIEVQVLDLGSVGGGLTPLRTGGFGQSISLHFTGEDGRRYTVRSLDKDPTKRIWSQLKNTVVEDVLQDLISALLPTGALVVDPLMEATGILHSKHTLVVIPDDPRLGKYRDEFAGLIGTLQEHPSEGPDGTPGFAGSVKISGTEKVWKHLEKGPRNRVDAAVYLKARLMDFLINDKDRHSGQWRWARFPDGDNYKWAPIPEDRDQAFINLDGFAMALGRRAVPKLIKFQDKYPSLIGLSINGWELDREFLAELEKSVWDSVTTVFVKQLPDPLIDDAVRRLPKPYYELIGESLAHAIKSRRDQLPKFVSRYYDLITRQAEIKTTEKDEYVELEHKSNGDLSVRIGVMAGGNGAMKTPYFTRTFHPKETKEIRFYLQGGDDKVTVLGGKGKITVLVDGGGGDDSFANNSQTGAGKTRFFDSRGNNRFDKGKGAKVNQRPYTRPVGPKNLNTKYTLDWGKLGFSFPIVTASPDLGAYVGIIGGRSYFGHRKDPFSSRHAVSLGLASNGLEPFVAYTGRFHHVWPNIDWILHLEFSGINVIRFNGLGNETEIPGSTSFYDVDRKQFVVAPSFEFQFGGNRGGKEGGGKEVLRPKLTATVGPVLKYSDTPMSDNDDQFIGSLIPTLYGTESFGQVGAQAELKYDTRNNPGYATKGLLIRAAGVVYLEVWDVESTFGSVNGAASTYLTANMPTSPTLALRVGGEKVWGTFPFHEATYLGGPSNLRGFRQDRFGGDASAYGNAELRFRVGKIKFLVPGEFGLFGAADVGRVFLDEDPDDADEWHSGFGGGFWLSFLHRVQTISVGIINGDDLTGVYVSAGFAF